MRAACLQSVGEDRLVAEIAASRRRVVFMAPGASVAVARALCEAWGRLGPAGVVVVLDVDAEVCRFGLGTEEAIQSLQAEATRQGQLLCREKGLRLGLLVADDRLVIFSPTPLLLEARRPSDAGEDKNTVFTRRDLEATLRDIGLDADAVLPRARAAHPNAAVFESIPTTLAEDLGLGDRPELQRSLGLDPVRREEVERLADDLRDAPPQRFDLARRVRVYTARFQFVEFKLLGCAVSRRKVAIPPYLVGLEGAAQVAKQFHAQFDLVGAAELVVKSSSFGALSEKTLAQRKLEIAESFLVSIVGFGPVVLRSRTEEFQTAVEDLKARVATFGELARVDLQRSIEASRAALVEALLPAVERRPPAKYTKKLGARPERAPLRRALDLDLKDAFGTADDLLSDMEVKLIFKDVTYESLNDPTFLAAAREALPEIEHFHEEGDAVRAEHNEPQP